MTQNRFLKDCEIKQEITMYLLIMQIVVHYKAVLICESTGSIRILLCACCSSDTNPKCSAKKGQ